MVALPGFNTHLSKLNVNDKDRVMMFVIIYKPCTVNKWLWFLWFVAQKVNICTERLNWGGGGEKEKKKASCFSTWNPHPREFTYGLKCDCLWGCFYKILMLFQRIIICCCLFSDTNSLISWYHFRHELSALFRLSVMDSSFQSHCWVELLGE